MTFLWPEQLRLAVLLPLLVMAYLWLLRRRRRMALRLANVALVKQAAGRNSAPSAQTPPTLALASGLRGIGRCSSATDGSDRLADRSAHDHPGDGRVRQHARGRLSRRTGLRRAGRRQGLAATCRVRCVSVW